MQPFKDNINKLKEEDGFIVISLMGLQKKGAKVLTVYNRTHLLLLI
jgi:hypothetical protein